MEGGGSIIIEAARKAAAAARTERAARVAAMRPVAVRNYHGVHLRRNRYCAAIWNVHTKRMLWLGSYETPEEAAYAYDAAARATRGHRARPNFPEPAPEKVSTDLVLPLPTPTPTPTPAARPARRELPPVPLQACFDNWLMAGLAAAQRRRQQEAPAPPALFPRQQQQQRPAALPPFTQFFHLAGPATAAAAGGGAAGAAVVNHPSGVPGAYILTPQNVQVPPANPASTELSSTDPVVVRAWQFFPAAAPIQHRELPVPQSIVVSNSDAVVADNFHLVASMSSAAPPPLPQLTLMDLAFRLGLPGRGGPGGAAH